MACIYTFGGNLLDCRDSIGGIKEIYIADYSWISDVTLSDGTEIISEISLTSTNKFKTYKVNKQTCSLNTTINISEANGTTFYQTDLTLIIPKKSAAKRLEIMAMAVGNMAIIARDNNGVYWYMGYYNPVTSTAGAGATGTAFGDANQYTITLTDLSPKMPFTVLSSIMAGITDGNISLPV